MCEHMCATGEGVRGWRGGLALVPGGVVDVIRMRCDDCDVVLYEEVRHWTQAGPPCVWRGKDWSWDTFSEYLYPDWVREEDRSWGTHKWASAGVGRSGSDPGGPMIERCAACNGGPEHHTGLKNTPHGWGDCLYWWVYRGREGMPFRLVRF